MARRHAPLACPPEHALHRTALTGFVTRMMCVDASAARDEAAVSNSRYGGTIPHAEREHLRSIAGSMLLVPFHSSASAPTS